MSVNFNNHNIITSGNLTALSGIFTTLQVDGGSVASYTAGSGLQLNGFTFDAKTATTSSSGITILSNTINSDENKALTPKAIDDAGYVDGTGTTNYIVKWSDSNTLTSGIIYDNGTNVGIGTASPSSKLHVVGNATFDASSGVPVTITNTGTGNSFVVNDAAGDTSPFVVDAEGRVLVGATSGTYPLTIVADSSYKGIQLRGRAADGISDIQITSNDGATQYGLIRCRDDRLLMRFPSGGHFAIEDAGSVRALYVQSDRKIGIGKSSADSALDVNGVITVSAGSAEAPAIVAAGDPNTGVWFPTGGDRFAISTDGLERLRINNLGNVGIGTNSPSARLNVEAGNVIFNDLGGNFDFRVEGDTDSNLLFTDASTDRVGIGTNTPTAKLEVANGITGSGTLLSLNGTSWGDSEKVYLSWNRAGSYVANIGAELTGGATNANIVFETASNTERMRIASNGNVGIGTSSPTNKLTVIGAASFGTLARTPNNADAAGFYDRIEAGGGTQATKSYGSIWLYNSSNTQTHWFHSYPGTNNYINNGGNFGIGTSSPSYKLDVNGDIGLTNGGLYSSPTGTIIGTNGWIYQSGQIVNSQGSFADDGDAQSSQYILRTSTTNNTWTPVKNNGSDAILLASNRTYSFSINIVGRRTNGQDNAGYKLEGVLYNDGYGADFVGSTTKTVLAESDSTWDVRVSISGAGAGGSDYLLTEVLGASSKNINWVAKIDLLEVGGGIEVDGYSYTEVNALSLDDSFIP